MRQELLNRLVAAKYLFEHGADAFDRALPFSAGVALLAFQDATEMVLRVVADHTHAQLKNDNFHQLLDAAALAAGGHLPYKTGLTQLNQARVAFKHHGLAPQQSDVAKFRIELPSLFSHLLRAVFGLSFEQISLASLVKHQRTANWLRDAEVLSDLGLHRESAKAAGVALAVFRSTHLSRPESEPPRESWRLQLLREWSHEQVEQVFP